MILGITGHRPEPNLGGYKIPNPVYDALKLEIAKVFQELKPNKIISGMAQGTDQYAVEVAISLGIPFIAALPCNGQDKLWPQESRNRYKELLDKAESYVVVSPGEYTKSCMHKRDQYLVDNSDSVLAVWNGQKFGGTFATVRMAEKANKSIYRINPDELEFI